jgi:hypothetical protein
MNKKYNIKTKIDGKYHTFGNVLPGEKGPRCGLRVSPELRKLVADVADGAWLNFLMFEDDGQHGATKAESAAPSRLVDDTIPF